MTLSDFLDLMERIAPKELAWERDNPGLLIGTERKEIKRVLIALDATPVTVREAIDYGAELLLTHHPLFWNPVQRILPDDPETAAAYQLIRHGVGLFAAHTNLDAAQGGVNDQLSKVLRVLDAQPLPPDALGRIGRVEGFASFGAFAAFVQETLHTTVHVCGDMNAPISNVALIGGAGGSELPSVLAAGAGAFVTGELSHDRALWAQQAGLNVIVAGHYETERVVLEPLARRLQEAANDVQYKVTCLEGACLRGL
ncbi:MAG: Nif3-like dinuclear metal center hexameric protein [Clostridia bacterium]|nr:Nif3-like dinuclear metal center hexameric protein [Clostridia bacterium]